MAKLRAALECQPNELFEWLPHAEGFSSAVIPEYNNTGDGELMGMWIGAAMDRKPHCTNIHYDLIDGTLDQVFGAGIPWLKVNTPPYYIVPRQASLKGFF